MARELARSSQLEENWVKYRNLRNVCTKLQRNNKSEHMKQMYEKIENEGDRAKLYSITKNLLGWKSGGPPTRFNIEGKIITKQVELANAQATYYVDKVKKIKFNLPRVRGDPLHYLKKAYNQWRPVQPIPPFRIKKVTEKDIIEILSKHKNSHSFGHDQIDFFTLKLAKKYLAQPIARVINLSLETGKFCNVWKAARIIPLLKSSDSDTNLPKSFCPVSQLSAISKVAESLVQRQLLEYLETTHQISGDHHAYRKWTSTTSALMEITDMIAKGTDENLITSTMSVDLTAAFDCVEHRILLDKLKFYNLDPNAMRWIESYLTARSSYVAIGNGKSDYFSNVHGVPQGSVLGPLLYLIYVNEMGTLNDDDCQNDSHFNTDRLFGNNCQDCGQMTFFADDGQYTTKSNMREVNQIKLQRTFDKIVHYLASNGLEVNQGKTCITEYMSRQKRCCQPGHPPVISVTEVIDGTLMDTVIRDKTYCRLLGGNFRNDLSWDPHLSMGKKALLPGVRQQLGALSTLRNILSVKAKPVGQRIGHK